MLSVTSVNGYNPYFKANVDNEAKKVPMRAVSRRAQQPKDERSEYEKKVRNAKIARAVTTGAGVLGSLALVVLLVLQIAQTKKGGMLDGFRTDLQKQAVDLIPVDLSKIKPHSKESYADALRIEIDNIMKRLSRSDIEAKKGKRVTQVLFEGPGGTGKTRVVIDTAKIIEEMFPKSEFYMPDLSVIDSSSYYGQTVQMLSEIIEKIMARADELMAETLKAGKSAKESPKVTLLLDELDVIAMEDKGMGAKNSNLSVNVLKRLFNKLKEKENVIVMCTTNKANALEGAIDSRMADKVHVGFLNKKQLLNAMAEWYKPLVKNGVAESILADANNPKMSKLCEKLTQKIEFNLNTDADVEKYLSFLQEHNMEIPQQLKKGVNEIDKSEMTFRIWEAICDNAVLRSPENGKIRFEDIIKSITEDENVYKRIHLDEKDLADLNALLK